MLQFVMALMLLLNRRRPEADIREVASAIAQVAQSPADARVLVTIHFNESGFNPRHRIPFGVLSMRGSTDIVEAARRALHIWSNGLRSCRTVERAFRYYITGRCPARPTDAGRYGDPRVYTSVLARLGGPAALAAR